MPCYINSHRVFLFNSSSLGCLIRADTAPMLLGEFTAKKKQYEQKNELKTWNLDCNKACNIPSDFTNHNRTETRRLTGLIEAQPWEVTLIHGGTFAWHSSLSSCWAPDPPIIQHHDVDTHCRETSSRSAPTASPLVTSQDVNVYFSFAFSFLFKSSPWDLKSDLLWEIETCCSHVGAAAVVIFILWIVSVSFDP